MNEFLILLCLQAQVLLYLIDHFIPTLTLPVVPPSCCGDCGRGCVGQSCPLGLTQPSSQACAGSGIALCEILLELVFP